MPTPTPPLRQADFLQKNNPANGVNSRLAKRLVKVGRLGDDRFDDVSLVLNARQPGIQYPENDT